VAQDDRSVPKTPKKRALFLERAYLASVGWKPASVS